MTNKNHSQPFNKNHPEELNEAAGIEIKITCYQTGCPARIFFLKENNLSGI